MRVRALLIIAALTALAIAPSTAAAATKAKLRFASATYTVAENAGTAHVTVTRNARSGKSHTAVNTAVSVAYSTTNGTATAGSDYTAASGRLSFPACTGNPAASNPCLTQTFDVA